MSVAEAVKEVQRIATVLLSAEPTEEALAIADAMPDEEWNLLYDDIPPREVMAREVTFLLRSEALHREIIDQGRKVLNATSEIGMSHAEFIEWVMERLEGK